LRQAAILKESFYSQGHALLQTAEAVRDEGLPVRVQENGQGFKLLSCNTLFLSQNRRAGDKIQLEALFAAK